jgi:O-acetylhomoserine (thiol)-lyase
MSTQKGFTTQILHGDRWFGTEHSAVHKPIHTSSQYSYNDAADLVAVFQGKPGYSYARQGTPTTSALEDKLTHMEAGRASLTFATGMAALAAVFTTLLKSGDHIVASQFVFGNTNSLFGTLTRLGIEVSLVDATDVMAVKQAVRPETKLVFVETVANPGTQVADLEAIGAFCNEHKLIYLVDNTLTSPWLFRPKDVGATFSMNSLSKHIGGHAHALGGSLTDTGLFDWSDFENIVDTYRFGNPTSWGLTQVKKKALRDMGATLAAEPAHRLAVGAETLSLRLDRACDNALKVAQFLDQHPGVAHVAYPGLPHHPQHDRAKKLFKGRFSTLVAATLKEDIDCIAFLNQLKIVILATHVGDTRTLALPAAKTIYHEMGPALRQQMGIGENLIRFSIGIEESEDLIADLSQAFVAMQAH